MVSEHYGFVFNDYQMFWLYLDSRWLSTLHSLILNESVTNGVVFWIQRRRPTFSMNGLTVLYTV